MIELKRVSFSYGKRKILSDISIRLPHGEFLAILGSNGAGKSTLIKLMSGLLNPDKGKILLDGADINSFGAYRLSRMRAVLEQECELSFDYKVSEVVELAFFGGGIDRGLVKKCLSEVSLENFEGRIYTNLSGGEKRRVQLARALCQMGRNHKGKTLFLDEPSAGLDPAHSHAAMAAAKKAALSGAAVAAVLHDPNLAAAYADKIAVLKNGKLSAYGSVSEVFSKDVFETAYSTTCEILDSPFGKISIFPPQRG